MKLSDKGPIRPAPAMPDLLGRVADEVRSWPDVISATHWDLYRPDVADGADFYVGDTEIGHLHFYGEAHVASDSKINAEFTRSGKAQPFRFRNESTYRHWTQVTITTEGHAQNAIDLFKANYRRLLEAKFAKKRI